MPAARAMHRSPGTFFNPTALPVRRTFLTPTASIYRAGRIYPLTLGRDSMKCRARQGRIKGAPAECRFCVAWAKKVSGIAGQPYWVWKTVTPPTVVVFRPSLPKTYIQRSDQDRSTMMAPMWADLT